jgi:hypothetical protein
VCVVQLWRGCQQGPKRQNQPASASHGTLSRCSERAFVDTAGVVLWLSPPDVRLPVLQLDVDSVDFRYVEGEVVALASRTDEYLSITGSGVALWRLLEAGTDRPAMVTALTQTYDVDAQRAGTDVDTFLADLEQRGLLRPVTP